MTREATDADGDDQDPEEAFDDDLEPKDESRLMQKRRFENISQSLVQKLHGRAPWLDRLDRAGLYEPLPEAKEKDPEVKTRGIFKDKLKIGCYAVLYVHKFKPGRHPDLNFKGGDRLVRITYYPEHSHELGDSNEFQYQRVSDGLKERIRHYLEIGLGSRQIREKLTLLIGTLHKRLAEGNLTRDDFVTADDVGNVVNAYWKKKAEFDKSVQRSLCSWMDKLASKNYFVIRVQDGKVVDKLENRMDISAGFVSPWQLNNLRSNPQAVGFDSTPGTIRFRRTQGGNAVIGRFELFTVLVQDQATMRGVPGAFLLTANLQASPIQLWLSALNETAGPFRYITTDDSSQAIWRSLCLSSGTVTWVNGEDSYSAPAIRIIPEEEAYADGYMTSKVCC
ncbi:hypothetical protein B0O80DRAFT_498786 [Mortierella sp. GBAus27b]|nr:hypothetical protein B0O80DRAFT_498786 [Mortierella sp. GBAus27b]